jgi:hypothetical protein
VDFFQPELLKTNMLSASHEVKRTRDAHADSVPELDQTFVFRGTLLAGDNFVFSDSEVQIGYTRLGTSVTTIFQSRSAVTGGYADKLIRKPGNHASTLEIWSGTGAIPADTTLYFGSTDAANATPSSAGSIVVNLTNSPQTVKCRLGLGDALGPYYDVDIVIHEAATVGQYDYLMKVIKHE